MQYRDDIAILNALKQGDYSAYDQLFKKYYKLLLANAYLVLQDEQSADDVVQVFFIDIWEKKLYLKMEGEIKGYLFRSVYNRSLNHAKQRSGEQQRKLNYQRDQEEQEDGHADRTDIQQQLQHALKDFPGQRRQAFTLVYLEEKKYQEAANEMSVSVNSLKTHLKIALKIVRERLKNNR